MPLKPLSETPQYTFPAGTFDVRGWDVKTMADGEKVGSVHDVLLDENGNARYLDVDLGLFQKHVLLPIGQGRVDDAEDVVWVPGMTKEQFKEIPEYTHETAQVNRDYENRVSEAYSGLYAGEQYYARPEYRTERPRMTGPELSEEGRLAGLDELDDFKVAEDEPDPRGWDVVASDGATIGAVSELIVDTTALKVRYMDVDLDEQELGLEQENRHILIPVGYARLNEDEEQVIVDAISSRDVAELPEFTGLPVTREFEERIHTTFTGGIAGEELYRHPRYSSERFFEPRRRVMTGDTGEARITRSEEELRVGKREVEAGEVEVEKHVETEPVRQEVTRRHEEVEIERRPAMGAKPGRIEEEEIRVPLTEEELVVEKRPQVKEELVVRKRPVEEREEIQTELRKERIDVEREGRVEEEEEKRRDLGR